MDIAKDAGTWIAVAGAVIAAAAAWYGRGQARAANRSAEAADKQAAAAEGQVIIMRQQLAYDKADHHMAAAPGFTFPESTMGRRVALISVKQVGGPKLSEVTVTVQRDDYVRGLIGNDGGGLVETIRWANNAPGSIHHLKVSLATARPVNIVLDFTSVGAGTGETWTYTGATLPRG